MQQGITRKASFVTYSVILIAFQLDQTRSLTLPPAHHSSSKRIKPLNHPSRRNDPLCVERELQKRYSYIIGCDESGRGCIAGPVVAASVCILQDFNNYKPIPQVDDGKNVSPADRHQIYQHVINHPDIYAWSVATSSSEDIDNTSIEQACQQCLREALEAIPQQGIAPADSTFYAIVDGKRSPRSSIPATPYVQGDAYVYSVALASILARVTHERLLKGLAQQFPCYGFETNLGYSTQEHILSIHEHGLSPIHRTSCKPNKGRSVLSRKSFCTALVASTVGLTTNQSPASAVYKDSRTGISLPEIGDIENAIPSDWSNIENSLLSDELFGRLDNTDDSIFYSEPRFVEHIDEYAVKRLTKYISQQAITPETRSVLDLCSSWTSHIDSSQSIPRVVGLGMNAQELKANTQLTEWTVQDLNQNPKLSFEDNSFDVVLCQLSIDYLTRPLETCREIGRVLRPGGKVHILFSNRLFLQKAVGVWTGADDIDHAFLVASYLHFCNGGFKDIRSLDLSQRQGQKIVGDPLYVVVATKS